MPARYPHVGGAPFLLSAFSFIVLYFVILLLFVFFLYYNYLFNFFFCISLNSVSQYPCCYNGDIVRLGRVSGCPPMDTDGSVVIRDRSE